MKKNILVNVLIIFCMIMLCSCRTKTEETHTTDDSIEMSSADTEVTASYWNDFEKELVYDDVSKEKKETLREGKDKYILNLNSGEELCVYLSFNPDEYVVTDEADNSIFEINRLLCDYGWSENNTYDVHKQNYEIDNGDMTIKLTITFDERMDSVTRVKCLNYDIVKKEDKRSYFYNYSERFRLPTNNVECEPHIDDEATKSDSDQWFIKVTW